LSSFKCMEVLLDGVLVGFWGRCGAGQKAQAIRELEPARLRVADR
jgi:hypothetical protein